MVTTIGTFVPDGGGGGATSYGMAVKSVAMISVNYCGVKGRSV